MPHDDTPDPRERLTFFVCGCPRRPSDPLPRQQGATIPCKRCGAMCEGGTCPACTEPTTPASR